MLLRDEYTVRVKRDNSFSFPTIYYRATVDEVDWIKAIGKSPESAASTALFAATVSDWMDSKLKRAGGKS